MIQKQKRLNLWTDMRALGRKVSAAELEALQRQRLERWLNPESPTHQNASGVSAISPPPPDAIEVLLGNREEDVAPPRSMPQTFWKRIVPSFIIFLSVCLLALSAFPLAQSAADAHRAADAVLGRAVVAYDELGKGSTSLLASDLEGARGSLEKAYRDFTAALDAIGNLGPVAGLLPQAAEGQKILSAAQEATLALQYITAALEGSWMRRPGEPARVSHTGDARESIENFRTATRYIAVLKQTLDNIQLSLLPERERGQIERASAILSELSPRLQTVMQLADLLGGFLDQGEKNYLLLFQNFRELRPTGGFIGTYGVLRLTSGRIKDLKIESVYNIDGQLKEVIAPPGPLQRLVSPEGRWGLRDSNWFFDFPSSARKAAEFFYKETGQQVDGVIAFTPAVFERLLKLTGPIPVPGYEVTLTAENFTDQVQYQTSVVYDRQLNQPKKFLSDFAPRFLDRLYTLDAASWLQGLDILVQALNEKDILLFTADTALEEKIQGLNWGGAIRSAPSDYLAVVHANVGAGKTDQDISQTFELTTQLQPDGSARHRLIIRRRYTPGREKDFPLNVDYVRVYVPHGSSLTSARGFDAQPFYPSSYPTAASDADLTATEGQVNIDTNSRTVILQESGRTVFANWISLSPGDSREVTIEYTTPPPAQPLQNPLKSYSMLVQKQPGAPVAQLTATLELPAGAKSIWRYPVRGDDQSNFQSPDDRGVFSGPLTSDLVWGTIFQ